MTSGRSGAVGSKVKRSGASTGRPVCTIPGTGGSSRIAVATVEASTGRAKETLNAVDTATRSPAVVVATIEAVVAPRVRKTARAGRGSGWPEVARAPASTVTVWKVPASQRVRGETMSSVPVSSQARSTAVAGSTSTAAATEAGSIGAVKSIVTGSVNAWPVSTAAVNSDWASGAIGTGGTATVTAGGVVLKTPIPVTRAKPIATAYRAAPERRSSAAKVAATMSGAASSAWTA